MMNEPIGKDNREMILTQAKALIAHVEQAYAHRAAVHELEREVFSQLLRLGHQLLELFFGLSGPGDQGVLLRLSDGREVKRLERHRVRAYRSVFGEHALERVVYGTREGQKIEYVPLDAQLQLPASTFSYLLQEWDQALAVEQPYGQVSQTLERIVGCRQSVHSLERMNRQLSGSVAAFWDARAPAPVAQGQEVVVCSADAKGVVMRREANADGEAVEVSSTTDGAGGKKMALIGAVYTIAPYVRTPAQVLEALFAPSDSDRRCPLPRPRPVAKYVRASLERDAEGTMAPSYEGIFSWLADEQRQRNPQARQPVVVLMDGQRSLWCEAEQAFADIDTVEVLDLMHALSYLWDAAELVYPNRTPGPSPKALKHQRLVFVKHQTERVLNGQIQTVIRSLSARRSALDTSQRNTLAEIVGYLRNNASRMQYDQYLHAGYPIATGVIEGACRHVVCDRMERSGMRWVMAGAKAMLGLRCIGINQEWDDFMRFHIEREKQRLYPVTAANEQTFIPTRLVA